MVGCATRITLKKNLKVFFKFKHTQSHGHSHTDTVTRKMAETTNVAARLNALLANFPPHLVALNAHTSRTPCVGLDNGIETVRTTEAPVRRIVLELDEASNTWRVAEIGERGGQTWKFSEYHSCEGAPCFITPRNSKRYAWRRWLREPQGAQHYTTTTNYLGESSTTHHN